MAKNKEKKTNPILFFIFAVVIPLTIVIGLVLVILSFTDTSASQWMRDKGSNIPVISKLIPTEEEQDLEEQLAREERKNKKQAEEIEELTLTVENLEQIIDQVEEEKIKLENKYESESNTNAEEQVEAPNPIKKMASSFRKMKSKQAAEIFQDLDEEIALQLMEELSNDVRGKILEEMDPKRAAKLTESLVKKE